MSRASNNGWKVCSRGHHYRGTQCPICWKGHRRRRATPRRRVRAGARTRER